MRRATAVALALVVGISLPVIAIDVLDQVQGKGVRIVRVLIRWNLLRRPELYARLYRAAYAGIKQANPQALVAIGETSSHGGDVPSRGRTRDSRSPARFARLLSEQRPQLKFDAWAPTRIR